MSINKLRENIKSAIDRMLNTSTPSDQRISLKKIGNTNLTDFIALFGDMNKKLDLNHDLASYLIHSAEAKAFKEYLIKNSESEFNNSFEGIFYTCI